MSAGRDGDPRQVPDEVRAWMERFVEPPSDGSAPALADGAFRALREALDRPGRNREAAFALLAADGLLTRAVEALTRSPDPARGFEDLLRQVTAESRSVEG